MKKIIYIISVWIFCLSGGFAQSYDGFFDSFFLRQQANAQAEAMGRGHATMTGSPFSVFYNPASSAFSEGVTTEFSRYIPNFGYYPNAHTNSYGVTINLNKFGAVTFNEIYYTYNETYNASEDNVFIHPVKSKLDILNYSYKFPSDFSLGINIDYFWNDYVQSNDNGIMYDIGFLKRFILNIDAATHIFFLGLSCTDITDGNIERGGRYTSKYSGPTIARIGASYEFNPNIKLINYNAVKALIAIDGKFVTNNNYDRALQLGTEFTFCEALKLRGGYYNDNVDTDYDPNMKTDLSHFTWGVGINIPISKLCKLDDPLELQFDFARLKNPGYYYSLANTKLYSESSAYYSIYSLKLNVGI
jgi:hypothetical protein